MTSAGSSHRASQTRRLCRTELVQREDLPLFRQIRTLDTLAVALTLIVVAFARPSPGAALVGGTTADPVTGHPTVRTRTFVIEGEVSLFAFTGDGIVFASDREGASALGSWDAPDGGDRPI